jgi:hypothetical protein
MLQDLPEDLINTTEDILHEARRNPDQNPRIGPLTRLEEYKDDPNIFISFTAVDKAGLKPLSDYNTPLGIYCYPLKISWDYYGVDKILKSVSSRSVSLEQKIIKKAFPFATENPYIQVIRAKKPLTNISKISQRDVDKTIDQIKDILFEALNKSPMFSGKASMMSKGRKFNELLEKVSVGLPGRQLWYLTNYLSGGRWKDHPSLIGPLSEVFQEKYRSVVPMRVWNYLLRDLGFNGFVDEGNSIIHHGEPAQAVFLHRGAFKKVDRILNKASVLSNKKNKTPEWLIKAKTSNEDYSIIGDVVVWHRGVWEYGDWMGGTWEDGIFEEGSFENGLWKNGLWKGGTFENGLWEFGIVEGDGRFGSSNVFGSSILFNRGCIWEDGTWRPKKGVFAGVWHYGLFNSTDSLFIGTWKDGTFMNGVFGNIPSDYAKWIMPRWEGGEWEGGEWAPGLRKAEIYSKRFDQYILSEVPPPEFYRLENDDSIKTPEELQKAAESV